MWMGVRDGIKELLIMLGMVIAVWLCLRECSLALTLLTFRATLFFVVGPSRVL